MYQGVDMLVEFKDIILPLSSALGLSLVVERAIEFIKNILGYFTLPDNIPAVVDIKSTEKKLKELEKENARLKTLVADLSLDNAIIKEIISKK